MKNLNNFFSRAAGDSAGSGGPMSVNDLHVRSGSLQDVKPKLESSTGRVAPASEVTPSAGEQYLCYGHQEYKHFFVVSFF